MTRLPIWMFALVLAGCFSKTVDDNDDDDDWGEGSSEEPWSGGGSSPDPFGEEGSSDGEGGGSGGESGAGSADVGAGTDCDVFEVRPVYPESDGADFYYRGHVAFVFDGIDEDATITLIGGTEGDIAGSTYWDENVLYFAPTRPLSPMSWYTAQLSHCDGESTIGFTTSALGTALDAGVDLVGKSYVVDLDSGRFVKPAGVGGLLLGLLEQHLLLGVNRVSSTEIQMMGAMSQDKPSTRQDTCEPSFDFPVAGDFISAPFFSIGPESVELSLAGVDVVINDMIITGDFASDGSTIGGAVLAGLLDARALARVLVDNGLIEEEDPSAVCDLIATFGVLCDTCSDGRDYCLDIYIDRLTANEVGETLLEVETCDVDTCDEGCDE